MKKIKIKFADCPGEFDQNDNYLTRALRRYYDPIFSEEPDFLFYSVFGTSFLHYNCVRIFFSGEPVVPNFNDCDYAVDYNRLDFGPRHFRAAGILGNVGKEIPRTIQDRSFIAPALANRKFCNFIYSNTSNGSGAKLRQELCRKLSLYKPVDCPGPVMKNMHSEAGRRYARTSNFNQAVLDESWATEKLRFLQNYKFTIAFENTAMNGYASEKLVHPFEAGSIPIYWGDPEVSLDFNPRAFVNCKDFHNDMNAVVARVAELDRDNEKYLEMLRQPPMQSVYDFNQEQKLAEYLASIIEKGDRPYEKNALGFPSMSAVDLIGHCYQGDVGIRTIAKALQGWVHYKAHGRRQK